MYNFLMPLLAALKYPSIHTPLTLSHWTRANKSRFQSEKVIFERSNVTKKLSPRISVVRDVTHAFQLKMTSRKHFSWNCMNECTKSTFEVVVTSYVRKKNLDEIKKYSRTSPKVQFKKLSVTKQKLDLERTEWIGKTISKKSDQKNIKTENQRQNYACE